MEGIGPLLLTITPHKVIQNFVVFEAHIKPCPVYDDSSGGSIEIKVFDSVNQKGMWWIKNKDVIKKEGSSLEWKQEFNDVNKIKDKGYFIVPINQKNAIKATVNLSGYTCLNEMDIDSFNVASYMMKESGFYYHHNGVIVNWKPRPNVIEIQFVDNDKIVVVRDTNPQAIQKDIPQQRRTIDVRMASSEIQNQYEKCKDISIQKRIECIESCKNSDGSGDVRECYASCHCINAIRMKQCLRNHRHDFDSWNEFCAEAQSVVCSVLSQCKTVNPPEYLERPCYCKCRCSEPICSACENTIFDIWETNRARYK